MKYAQIGSRGHGAWYAMQCAKELPDWTCAAVCGDGDDVNVLAGKYHEVGHQPRICATPDEVWTMRPDAVIVDGPFELHATRVCEALERDIPVFAEKPLALTFPDYRRLEAAVAKTKAFVTAMTALRFNPAFAAAKVAFDQGKIGKIRLLQGQKSYKLGTRQEFYKHRESYGGTLPWVGSHALDWLLWFTGELPQRVFAAQSRVANGNHGDLESSAQAQFMFPDEIVAQISTDYFRPAAAATHGDDRLRVVGTDGILEVRGEKAYLLNAGGEQELPLLPAHYCFVEFINSLPRHPSSDDAMRLTLTCLKTQEAADTGRIVEF